jgi:uncharacterized membrane protein
MQFSFWAFPLVFLLGFYTLYHPDRFSQWLLGAALLLPWLSCVGFIVKRHRQGLLWFSLLVLCYLLASLIGVQATWPQRLWPLVDTTLLTLCFIAIMGYLRVTGPKGRKKQVMA